MPNVLLTRGLYAEFDEEDRQIVERHRWSAVKGHGTFYAITNLPRGDGTYRTVRMHRLLLDEPKQQVDHRDRDGLNNRRSNLRLATNAQNQQNSDRRGKSGFKGVTHMGDRYKSKPWHAQIQVEGRKRGLGYYATALEAARAYNAAARQAFGEFAVVNVL